MFGRAGPVLGSHQEVRPAELGRREIRAVLRHSRIFDGEWPEPINRVAYLDYRFRQLAANSMDDGCIHPHVTRTGTNTRKRWRTSSDCLKQFEGRDAVPVGFVIATQRIQTIHPIIANSRDARESDIVPRIGRDQAFLKGNSSVQHDKRFSQPALYVRFQPRSISDRRCSSSVRSFGELATSCSATAMASSSTGSTSSDLVNPSRPFACWLSARTRPI